MTQDLMAKSPVPVPLQYVMLYLGLAIEILSAIFMLRAATGHACFISVGAVSNSGPPFDFASQAYAKFPEY